MRHFYKVSQKWQTMSAKLSWSHYCEIIWFDENKMNFYIDMSIKDNLSVRELRLKIKNKEYERLPDSTKTKLIKNEEIELEDTIKNPIIIKNSNKYEEFSERVLLKLILENIDEFLKELGEGFSYIGNQYKIKIGNNYNYIDILLFNIKFNCYVVIELKVGELRKEHIGQIEVYMNYIDKKLKNIYNDKTIGIIIVSKNNKFIMEYCSDSRVLSKEYILI